MEHCLQSTRLDPGYAPAWVTLASSYINQDETGQRDYLAAYQLATTAVNHAIETDPELPFAHSARAWIAFNFERDYVTAAKHFRIARTLFPNSSVILANASVLVAHLGFLDDAMALVSRSIALQPWDSAAYSMRGTYRLRAGRLAEAETDFQEALQLSPGGGYYIGNLALLRILQGRPAEALEYEDGLDDESLRLAVIAMATYDLGDTASSEQAMAALVSRHAGSVPFKIAMARAWRHEADAAFRWLERAINGGHSIDGIKTDPFLSVLHEDVRWQPTLEKLGLSDDQVAAVDL